MSKGVFFALVALAFAAGAIFEQRQAKKDCSRWEPDKEPGFFNKEIVGPLALMDF